MNDSVYIILLAMLDGVDSSISLTFKDGSTKDFEIDKEKIKAQLDACRNLDKQADWLAERMACECRGDDSVCGWCDKVNEIGAPYCVSMTKEKWREAARKAVEKEEANG